MTTYILTVVANHVTVQTGHDSQWLADRACNRAVANGAYSATVRQQWADYIQSASDTIAARR